MITHYKVLDVFGVNSAEVAGKMEELMRHELAAGWQPQGGLSIAAFRGEVVEILPDGERRTHPAADMVVYVQAMVKLNDA